MDRDEQDPSCVCLNLLWLDSAIARLPRQREPVVRHTCRREVHCGRVREVLEELEGFAPSHFPVGGAFSDLPHGGQVPMRIHIAEDGLMAKLRLEHEFPFRLPNPEP